MEKDYLTIIGALIALLGLLVRNWLKEKKETKENSEKERHFAVGHKLISQVNALKIRVTNLERDSERMFSEIEDLRDDSGKINVSYATITVTLANIQKSLDNLQTQFERIDK